MASPTSTTTAKATPTPTSTPTPTPTPIQTPTPTPTPTAADFDESTLRYSHGLGNHHASEAVAGALPLGQNSPQHPPFGLYTEQLSGTAFTASRSTNQRTWLYRIAPSVSQGSATPTPPSPHRPGPLLAEFTLPTATNALPATTAAPATAAPATTTAAVTNAAADTTTTASAATGATTGATTTAAAPATTTAAAATATATATTAAAATVAPTPNPLRWSPLPLPPAWSAVDWVDSLVTLAGVGSAASKDGVAVHLYAFNTPMGNRAFADSDGDVLLVPQKGGMRVITEMGRMTAEPGEVLVIPRNIRFSISPSAAAAAAGGCRGYVLETFSPGHFCLPELGPIGANGLAEPRDFEYPTAWFEDRRADFTVTTKLLGQLWDVSKSHSPFDVVAWHGNYAPFKYDLSKFHAVNSVTVDHSDPSIFTVLTLPGPTGPVADFVIFPPRWSCAEHTYRPPYFHKNCMSELMGLITGEYEAKPAGRTHADADEDDIDA